MFRLAERARVDGHGSNAWREFEREGARFDSARPGAYRYVPLAIVLPRLAVAMRGGDVPGARRVVSNLAR